MKHVAIIGLGLMGGSLGLALKQRQWATVSAYARRGETRSLALAMGAADTVHDSPSDALARADVVVFCTPVCSIAELAQECLPAFKPGCVVTDVGSTKADLVASMERLFAGSSVCFVGSHPMAGSERTGMESAHVDLYEDAITVLTPLLDTPRSAVAAITELWTGVGSQVVEVSPARHDDLVARSSHLPHLIAALLVLTSGRGLDPQLPQFCGAGFRDTSRIAGGSPEMWHDIIKTNESAILTELREYGVELNALISQIERKDYGAVKFMLERARQSRQILVG